MAGLDSPPPSAASEEQMLINIAAYQSSEEFLQSAQSIANGIMDEIFELHDQHQQKAMAHQRIKDAFGHLGLPHLDDSVWEAMPTTSDQRVLEEQKRKQRANLLKALDEGLQQVADQCFKPQQADGGGVGSKPALEPPNKGSSASDDEQAPPPKAAKRTCARCGGSFTDYGTHTDFFEVRQCLAMPFMRVLWTARQDQGTQIGGGAATAILGRIGWLLCFSPSNKGTRACRCAPRV